MDLAVCDNKFPPDPGLEPMTAIRLSGGGDICGIPYVQGGGRRKRCPACRIPLRDGEKIVLTRSLIEKFHTAKLPDGHTRKRIVKLSRWQAWHLACHEKLKPAGSRMSERGFVDLVGKRIGEIRGSKFLFVKNWFYGLAQEAGVEAALISTNLARDEVRFTVGNREHAVGKGMKR